MNVGQLKLGNTQINNNVFLAPMAGYTDYAFRHLILEEGAGLVFTELVSAKGLMYGGQGSKELLYAGKDYKKTAVQLFGSEEYYMRSACESEDLRIFDIMDINMGCPVPKVYKNGEGSALLNDIKKASKIVSECVKSGKTITVKIRTGLKYGDDMASEFCKALEDAGASLITIHGRVREAYYSGEPDYKAIEKAKNCVKIPIIANGGIFTIEDANKMMDRTGADGVMLARGGIANPFLFSEILDKTPTKTLKEFILLQLKTNLERFGEEKTAKEWRKFVPYYFKGMVGIKELKSELVKVATASELINLIEKNF